MFFSYIGVILHPYCVIPMYVCTIMHVCIMATKWSDKDTDCTCCVYLYLKMVYIVENHKNLNFPWIYDMFNFFLFEFLCP